MASSRSPTVAPEKEFPKRVKALTDPEKRAPHGFRQVIRQRRIATTWPFASAEVAFSRQGWIWQDAKQELRRQG